MDFKLISITKRTPNNYDKEETFVIPVKVIKIIENKANGPLVQIVIERLDFFTGELKKTHAFTFKKSVKLFEDLNMNVPFDTDGIVFKKNGKILFKIIGAYNPGLSLEMFDLKDNIIENEEEKIEHTEEQIKDTYEFNYQELRNWVGALDSNEYDIKNQN